MTCPKCKSDNTHQRQGALYFECWSCDYAWVPTQFDLDHEENMRNPEYRAAYEESTRNNVNEA